MLRIHYAQVIAGLALGLSVTPAVSAVVITDVSADISSAPFTITFEPGETLSFSTVSGTPNATIGVQTTGDAEVFSTLGEPAYFQIFATTLFPSQQLGDFSAYPVATAVPYSIVEGLVGFEFALSDGVHYGVAEIGSDTVARYAIDSTPGESFSLDVPEPAAWIMLLVGTAVMGVSLRRKVRSAARARTT